MEDIRSVLQSVMGSLSSKTTVKEEDVHSVWKSSVEEKMREHTEVFGIKNDALYVSVDCSAWMYQCRIQTKKLLKKIQHHFPKIQKIYFKIGKVR